MHEEGHYNMAEFFLKGLGCSNVANQPDEADNIQGVSHSVGSRCIEQGRDWSRVNPDTGEGFINFRGSGCYEVRKGKSRSFLPHTSNPHNNDCLTLSVRVQCKWRGHLLARITLQVQL